MKNAIKRVLNLFWSTNAVIILVVVLLFISGFVIYAVNRPASPSFHIDNVSFRLGEDARDIEFYVKVDKGSIELKQFFLNNKAIIGWTADKSIIREEEATKCMMDYHWKMGEYYDIKLVTTDNRFTELSVKAPEMAPSLQLEVKNVSVALNDDSLRVNANYSACSNGTDSLHVILFTYRVFENHSMPAYMFYDSRYMTEESLTRADSIIGYFGAYNRTIEKADYETLETLSNAMPRCMLIIVNPLKDFQGNKIEDATPAPLIDPDGDGFIRDDSEYGKTRLYDWMQDNGLILVTVGSLQPYKRIIYGGNTYKRAMDSNEMFDAHLMLTSASDGKSIINGSFVLGDYSPVRISGTMGLSYRESSFGFDKDSMEKHNLRYYAYGDYKLSNQQGILNLTLPAFIRVGEDGGWLAMGDEEFWLEDEQLAHDLFLICMQAVWDSEWIPYGWYWDSGSTFHNSCGELRVDNSLETSLPSHIVDDEIVVRIIAIAYSSDLDRGIIVEQMAEQRFAEVTSIEVDAVE
jgi:hypothetical protein